MIKRLKLHGSQAAYRWRVLGLAAGLSTVTTVASAQVVPGTHVPDVGFDSANVLAELGAKVGGDMVLVVGIGLALFAIGFVVRAIRRHAKAA